MKLTVSIRRENGVAELVEVDAPDCDTESEVLAQIQSTVFPDVRAAGGHVSVRRAAGSPHYIVSAAWPEAVYVRRAVDELMARIGEPIALGWDALDQACNTGQMAANQAHDHCRDALAHLDKDETDAAKHELTRARDRWSHALERKAENRSTTTTSTAREGKRKKVEGRTALANRLARQARNLNPDALAGDLAEIVHARMAAMYPETKHKPYTKKYLINTFIPGK